MSLYYRPKKHILAHELLDGRLTKYGITEYVCQESGSSVWARGSSGQYVDQQILTDGLNYVRVFVYVDFNDEAPAHICGFTAEITSDARPILDAIGQECDTEFYTDDDPHYYGEAVHALHAGTPREELQRAFAQVRQCLLGVVSELRQASKG